MHVIIPHIDEALGYSVVYEEYKGDFAQARHYAETALADARRRNDPAALADALLAGGAVHLLQGEPTQALACFYELEQVAPEEAAHQLRAIHYSWLAECLQFNIFPDGGGAAAEEIGARWNGEARLSSWITRKQTLTGQRHSPSLLLEAQLVFSLLPQLQSTRSIVQTSRFTASAMSPEFMLGIALPGPVGFRQDAEGVGADASILAYADLAAADLCRRAGNTESGGAYLEQALQTYQAAADRAGMAACHMMQGDWWAAPFSTPQAWNFALQESSSGGSGLAWTLEAREFDLDGLDLDRARAAYAEAEEGFREAGAPRGLAYVHLRYGYLAMLEGDHEAAVAWATRAREEFDACGDRLGYGLAQSHRLLAHIGAGLLPEDRETARTLGAWGAAEGSFSYALGLGLLFGRAGRHWLTRQADYERALACFRLAQALFEGLETPFNVGHSLVDQGTVFEALGEPSAVLTRFEKALDVYLESMFARAAIAEGALRHALMLIWDIYNLYLDRRDAEGLERIAARMEALIARSRGDRAATEADLTAYALESMAHSVLGQARVFAPLYRAVQARDDGDPMAAEQGFEAALDAALGASPGERDFLEAVIYAHQKRYPEAKAAFQRYLEQGGAGAGFIGPLASVLEAAGGEQGQREGHIQSVRTYEQAFGFMVRIKAYADARAYVQQLERLAPDWWEGAKKPWQSLSDYGEMHEGLTELTEAQGCYDRAIHELEVRRGRLSRDELKRALVAGLGAQYLYFQAARTALKLHEQAQERGDRAQAEAHAAAAFAYAERNKARALLDLMAAGAAGMSAARAESQPMRLWRQHNARLSLWRGLLARERRQQTPDDARIAHLEQQLETEEADLHRVEARLAQEDPDFFQAVNVQADVMALAEVSGALPADTALLQYYVLGEDLLAWAVTDQGMVEVRRASVDAKALARQVRAFHKACMSDLSRGEQQRELEHRGEELAGLLLDPFAGVLDAHPNLIVVPYGALHTLPFHALPGQGRPLGASHTFSYLPSASTLRYLRTGTAKKPLGHVLAVGNPANMSFQPPEGGKVDRYRPLSAAATEAAYVASLLGGEALLAGQATEPAVRERLARHQYPILHFATHGYLSEETPLLSSLLLADGEALSVYELMGMHLDVDLVVLSACRTGLGAITGGDDVVGLTRGLLGAGVRAAVVSLWPVNDVSTSLFMGAFYRHLREDVTPARALQAAQDYLRRLKPDAIRTELARLWADLEAAGADREALRPVVEAQDRDAQRRGRKAPPRDYSHPYYWAPFILVG